MDNRGQRTSHRLTDQQRFHGNRSSLDPIAPLSENEKFEYKIYPVHDIDPRRSTSNNQLKPTHPKEPTAETSQLSARSRTPIRREPSVQMQPDLRGIEGHQQRTVDRPQRAMVDSLTDPNRQKVVQDKPNPQPANYSTTGGIQLSHRGERDQNPSRQDGAAFYRSVTPTRSASRQNSFRAHQPERNSQQHSGLGFPRGDTEAGVRSAIVSPKKEEAGLSRLPEPKYQTRQSIGSAYSSVRGNDEPMSHRGDSGYPLANIGSRPDTKPQGPQVMLRSQRNSLSRAHDLREEQPKSGMQSSRGERHPERSKTPVDRTPSAQSSAYRSGRFSYVPTGGEDLPFTRQEQVLKKSYAADLHRLEQEKLLLASRAEQAKSQAEKNKRDQEAFLAETNKAKQAIQKAAQEEFWKICRENERLQKDHKEQKEREKQQDALLIEQLSNYQREQLEARKQVEMKERSRKLQYRDYLKVQMETDRDRKKEDHKDVLGRPEDNFETTLVFNANEKYQQNLKLHYKDYLSDVKHQADLKRAQRQREEAQEVKDETRRRELIQDQYQQLKKAQAARESVLRENLEQIRKESIQARKDRLERKHKEDFEQREAEKQHEDFQKARNAESSVKKKILESQMKEALKLQMQINQERKALKVISEKV